jgi:phosphatidylglycerol---prolipoprotein diacylglyceryl transferase
VIIGEMPSPMVHLALETLGFAVGGMLYWRSTNASTQPTDRWTRWGLLAGAALGSRMLYILQYWKALANQPLALWLGGKTIVGGLLGGLAGVEIAKRALKWRQSTGDGFVLPLLVGMAIGRIGCQLSGLSDLTYGNETSLPWGWDYGDGVARHPTALYEIIGLAALAWIVRRRAFAGTPGDQFRVFMVGYFFMRLWLEALKPPFGPPAAASLAPGRWGALSAIQWACLAGLAYYARDIYRWATPGQASA